MGAEDTPRQDTPDQIAAEIAGETEKTVKELSDRGDIERAKQFVVAFGDIQAALGKIAKALDRANFKSDKDYEKARTAFGEKLAGALQTLKTMKGYGATDLAIQETRNELNNLGVIADKGPASYPAPAFGTGFFKPSQVDLWLNDVAQNPAQVATEMADAARDAAVNAETAGPAGPTETRGRTIAAAEIKRLNQRTHGAFGINTGDE
ncbi:hypothetical protein HYW83_01185 [Candidatus Peregrinibacteria bacterium]|nr:hypothetical protein [Candidatus Peregrinibacteria bacterium]